MDKMLKIILWVIAIIGGGAIIYIFQAQPSYLYKGLEYVLVGVAVIIIAFILSIVLTVATIGALIRRDYNDPVKRVYFPKLIAATIILDGLILFYFFTL